MHNKVGCLNNRIALVAILLFCLLTILVVVVMDCSGEYVDKKQKLNEYCKKKLKLRSISRFNKFVRDLREIEANTVYLEKGLEHLARCLLEKESIYALHELITNYDKERPCKYSEVAKLEAYAKKYLLTNTKAIPTKFFTLFGVTIGINCRINLLAHLKQADSEVEQMDFIFSTAAPTGWNTLINEYTKKSLRFGESVHSDNNVINRVAKLVPGLSQIDQVDYLNFDHAMNDPESAQWSRREAGSYELRNIKLRPEVLTSMYKIIDSCKNLEKFYLNSVLAMAKLKGLGLMVDFLNDLHDGSALLHKWLVATTFCQLMARVKMITPKKSTSLEPYIQYEIIHDDRLLKHRHELYSYAAPFDEIHERAKDSRLILQAMVNEGSWRQKTEAMWPPTDKQPPTSVAMKLLVQYIRGVEHDFQQELNKPDE